MSNSNPTKKWKKGIPTPNPKGRGAMPKEVRAFRAQPHLPVFERLTEYTLTPVPILLDIIKDEKALPLDKMCAVWALECAKGNFIAIKEMLDRLFGKVKERIETTKDRDDQLIDIDPEKINALLSEAHSKQKAQR